MTRSRLPCSTAAAWTRAFTSRAQSTSQPTSSHTGSRGSQGHSSSATALESRLFSPAHCNPPSWTRAKSTSAPRRAAVAYASRPSPTEYIEELPPPQPKARQHQYYHDDDYADDMQGMTAAQKQDLEQALYPSWDGTQGADDGNARIPSQLLGWNANDLEHHQDVISGEDGQVQHDGDIWQEWIEEARRGARSEQRPELQAAKPLGKSSSTQLAGWSTKKVRQPSPLTTKPIPLPPPSIPALASSSVKISASSPIKPYIPTAETSSASQPHHRRLVSRHDWRLSSPVRRRSAKSDTKQALRLPPSLHVHGSTTQQGHNRLVGVGVDTARSGWWSTSMRAEEPWGWKTKLPASERGEWLAAEIHRKRLDRLIQLSLEADEKAYLELLARSGTPQQRESRGITICRARGVWLTATQVQSETSTENRGAATKTGKKQGSSGGGKAIAAWWDREGRNLSEEMGWKFTPGTILRFTALQDLEEGALRAAGRPLPPPSANVSKNFVQGHLLEVRDGELIVSFDEKKAWPIGDEEYRIDIGSDDSSYELQSKAIDNLFFDPTRQRQRNAAHVISAQDVHVQQGVSSILREWTLQGSDLRELVVPELEQQAVAAAERRAELDPASELFDLVADSVETRDDHSPAAELAHLPPVTLPLPLPIHSKPENPMHPASLFADNQLINSWIKRHQRDQPMSMTGDPELGLNESQTQAVAMALGERLSLIQGPPGTGKSQTIVSIITLLKRHFRIPQPILLAAPTHVSVDHLLSLLVREGLNPLRTGRADRVREDLRPWTIEARREQHPLWRTLEQTRMESEDARVKLQEFRADRQASPGSPSPEVIQQELDLEAKYRKSWRRFIALEQRLYASLLATADVFCATAIGSGASKVMSMVDFPIVFLDEAAMCTEPVSLIPIMKGSEHVCLIGDHKQLPAVVKSRDAVRERLHVSLFERLMNEQSVKSTLLDTQYRMRPVISAFPNEAFYHTSLRDASVVQSRSAAVKSQYLDPANPSTFISHSSPESTFRQSILNQGEVNIIIQLVGDLMLNNPQLDPTDIGIISPYVAQTRLLQDTFELDAGISLEPLLGRARAEQVSRVEINTVDGFQGREKDVIILSTVRSNQSGHIGFLTDQRRLNVALTRAKDALLVVGNKRTLKTATLSDWKLADQDADGGIWRRYLGWLEQRGLVYDWQEGDGVKPAGHP